MRRLALLLLAAAPLVSASPACGQTILSLHGGLNRTILAEVFADTTFVRGREPVNGMHVGVGATFWHTPRDAVYKFGIRLNGTYAQRGAAHNVIGGRVSIRLHYVLLNVMYDMGFPFRWERLAARFSAGPTMGRLLSCQREFEGSGGGTIDTNPCRDGQFNSLEYGLNLAGHLELGVIGRMGITAGVEYHWGANDIEDYPDTSLLNRALSLRGGLLYAIR